ncbi:hypothetical protein SLS56_002203 [Neofusicoccum ribis]|uniref:Uncharacterized protein n=1 Tax=Neofusicoccum ribis TaxID=45134 RepID=A0ABR3T4N3_9PEZI
MKTFTLCALLPLVSASSQVPRAESSSDSLYGYGVGIGGLPFIYADVALNSGVLAVTPTNTTWSVNKNLYINLAANAYDSAKIASSVDGYADTGFMFYGRILFHTGSSGMKSLFYATPIDSQNKTYVLKWNSDSADDGVSTPVALRTVPPS